MEATFRLVSDFENDVKIPLERAMRGGMAFFGYSAEKMCRTTINFMAQSASKMTKMAAKRRPVEDNPDFKHLLKRHQYKAMRLSGMSRQDIGKHYMMKRAYRLTQDIIGQRVLYSNSAKRISKIGNRGLAKRSWMWGFGRGRPIAGVAELNTLHGSAGGAYASSDMTQGYVLWNRLSYIRKAMPNGWEGVVEDSAKRRLLGWIRTDLRKKIGEALTREWLAPRSRAA